MPAGRAPRELLLIRVAMHASVGPMQGDHHHRSNALAQLVTVSRRDPAAAAERVLIDCVSLQTFVMLQTEALLQFLRRRDIGVANHALTAKDQLQCTEHVYHHMRHLALMRRCEFALDPCQLAPSAASAD